MNAGLKPAWASHAMRLDPLRLPQSETITIADSDGDVSFTIGPRGAVIRRTLTKSGLPIVVAVPARLFAGVAARALEDETGAVTVTLELLHNDPSLSVPLLVAADLDDVAADWRAWADYSSLPMLLIEADGVARSLEDSLGAAIKVAKAQERRQGSPTRQRRSRFLARRRQGSLGLRLVIDGREIIARD